MVKTSVDGLESSLKETLAEFELFKSKAEQANDLPLSISITSKAWLDIEIDNGDHLSDLSQRVSELVVDMPFEVLLVRRCKKARQRRQAQLSQQDNSTLSELSLAEVFDSRLSQLDWQTEEEVARKGRLKQLFTELSVELSLAGKQEKPSVEANVGTDISANEKNEKKIEKKSNKSQDAKPSAEEEKQQQSDGNVSDSANGKVEEVEQDNL